MAEAAEEGALDGALGGTNLAAAIRAGLALRHDAERDDRDARRVALELGAAELAAVCAALARLATGGTGALAPLAEEGGR